MTKKHHKEFVKRLREIRGERSQRQFAKEIGVFQQNMNRYELHGVTPSTDILMKIAVTQGVSLDWLLFGIGKKKLRMDT